MKVAGANGPRRVRNMETSFPRFQCEPVVAARNAHVKIGGKFPNRRLKDPRILARRMIEKTRRSVWLNVPARKAKELARQVAPIQKTKAVIEKDIRIGDDHSAVGEKSVGIGQQILKCHALAIGDEVEFRRC